jgi:hypothetical protein
MDKLLRFLDILIILSLLFNIGAFTLTRVMVMKNPGIVIKEANPVMAKLNNYSTVDPYESLRLLLPLMIHITLLSLLVAAYIWQRNTANTNARRFQLIACTIFIFFLCTFDFANDLGYWLGKLIFHQ